MDKKTGNIILPAMIIGAILGVVGGYYFSDIFLEIKFIGTIFLNALKMVVIPLIVASMIVGVTTLGDIRKLGRTTGKTLLYYLATTGFSVIIGLILVNIISPGIGVSTFGSYIPELVASSGEKTLIDVIVSLIPDNIFNAAAEGRILPLIVFSLIFGGVLTTIGARGRAVINFFEGLNQAIMKIVTLIIYFAPVGVLALIGGIVAENRDSVNQLVSGLGLYTITVIIGLLIHALIILPIILKLFTGQNPFKYFLNMGQALATAFTTASSSATLPITMNAVTEKNKVDSRSASFVLPLGATINMDGTALYEAVAALFIAQIYGIDLTLGAQIVIFLTATLASIGAAGIPHAGTVTMVFVLSAVGLPLEGIGLIWAVDWFLDRCRTTVNVWGDSIGAAVIGQTSEIKKQRRKTAPTDKTTDYRKPGRERTYSRDIRKQKSTTYQKSKPYRDDRKKTRPAHDFKQSNGSKYPASKRPGPPDRKDKQDRPQDRPQDRQRDRQQDRPQDRKYDKPVRHDSSPPAKRQYRSDSKPVKQDIRVQVNKDSKTLKQASLSRASLARDLDKVSRQLADKEKPVHSDKPAKDIAKKSDSFFDMDIPKFNFFDDDDKKKSQDDKSEKQQPSIASEPVSDKKKEPVEKPDSPKKESKPALKEPVPATVEVASSPQKKETSDSDKVNSDSSAKWGRGRKKRLSK